MFWRAILIQLEKYNGTTFLFSINVAFQSCRDQQISRKTSLEKMKLVDPTLKAWKQIKILPGETHELIIKLFFPIS